MPKFITNALSCTELKHYTLQGEGMPDKLSKTATGLLSNIDKSIDILARMFPGQMLARLIYVVVDREATYEDDGNTQCEGKKASFYVQVPLGRTTPWEDGGDYYSNYCGRSKYSVWFQFDLRWRVRDGKPREDTYAMVGVSGFPDENKRCTLERVGYSPCGDFVMTAHDYVKAARIIQAAVADIALEAQVKNVLASMES